MKILIDTNVLVDFLTLREPFAECSTNIIKLCMNEKISGYVAAHSILNMFFILRKEIPDTEKRRKVLLDITEFLDIVEVNKEMILQALKNNIFHDFEDCVQSGCAVKINADYIVTRNVKDFAQSAVTAITPEDFLNIFKENES